MDVQKCAMGGGGKTKFQVFIQKIKKVSCMQKKTYAISHNRPPPSPPLPSYKKVKLLNVFKAHCNYLVNNLDPPMVSY